MNDGMGTSAIIVRTEKGKNFLKKVKDKLKYEMVSEEDIVSNNSAECKSVCRPVEREYFYKDLEQMSYDKMIKKYVPVSLKVKIRKTVKRFFVGKIVKIFQVGGKMVNNSNYYVRYLIQNKQLMIKKDAFIEFEIRDILLICVIDKIIQEGDNI